LFKRFPTRISDLIRPRGRYSLLVGAAATVFADSSARASMLSPVADCTETGGDWSCYLPGIFHFLLVIAVILGLVLAGVIFLAVKSYLKNKGDEKVGS
jgi:hypothetical protein